jgi:hypothetical protein
MFQKLGGLNCSSGCRWRFESLVILACLAALDALRLARPGFSVSELRCFDERILLGGVVSETTSSFLEPAPDRSVVPSKSSAMGSLPVDEGKMFIFAACLR